MLSASLKQQACGSKVAAPCYSFLKEKDKKSSKNSGRPDAQSQP
jgi:hypothetical protein